jgi:putative phosphoserine phosphatase / 1-acylglycerol-3-phosphate O-acyltransferase
MSSSGAAFFDLDRTLLRGASGEVFADAMRAAGLVNRTIPGEKYLYTLFNTIGETLPSMALARQAVLLAKGRSRQAVQDAADAAADQLVMLVQPFANAVFESHRAAGRQVVLATTTPYDLVKPFADRLGLDDVIATRYGLEDDDDTYDGSLVGPFVWSAGKLEAVQEWADAHGVDLAESWFYSDSIYDTPLMSTVGNPVVVNPDPRMMLMAAARRWPTLNLDVSPGVLKVPVLGLELQRLALSLTRPMFVPYADIRITGVERIPADGPAILVGNHRSYFDATMMAMVVAKTGRTIRFLGKKEVFDAPLLGSFAKALGGIRVDRGTGSEEPLQAAIEALEGGEMVGLMPQGTIPRGPAFFDPVLKGRWGAARLAHATGSPVIPIGLWGTEKVWPRNSRLPRLYQVVDPPVVTASVGKPVELEGESLESDTERIMEAIAKQLPAAARRRHDPTPDELRATYPPGYRGNPDGEHDRRPGCD